MIERSRTLFVGFIAFVLVLVTFSSFQKNKQTEGFGSVTCKNKLKRFVLKYANACQDPIVWIPRIYGNMSKKLGRTFWTEKENLQLALEEIKTLTSKESVIEDIFEGIGSGELERNKILTFLSFLPIFINFECCRPFEVTLMKK